MAQQKMKFICSKCGEETDASITTERYKKALCRNCFGKRKDNRTNQLNDLTGAEWARHSKSIETYSDTRTQNQKEHGACFPKSLAIHQIEIYTKFGDVVLDPFMGVGTTMLATHELGRRSLGIELNPKFAKMCRDEIANKGLCATIYEDDANNMCKYIANESVDFILTSPPYANLLKTIKGNFAYKWREHSVIDPIKNPAPYSSNERDIGNMEYDDGIQSLANIMRKCYAVQKPNTYAVWIVKDFRDLKRKIPYINFHGDVIRCAEDAGYTLWDIRIYDQTNFRPLVCLGYPSRNYYLNISHSYMLVFKKTR
ncbi:MAG: site-specific DNA-methyltransferase [Clostridia bacterium]|nr:site-specific DNA-methyltransferase [Clostridia bacterium]